MLYKEQFLYTILFTFIWGGAFAQTLSVEGTVLNMENKPITNASVILYGAGQKILAYTTTDKNGYYLIEPAVFSEGFVEVNHLFYNKQRQAIPDKSLQDGKKLVIDFILEKKQANNIEAVLVKGKKNAGKDTVKLALKKLNLQEDDNLKAILEKMPYFVLGKQGTILYRGKNIDKILVNKKPSFEHQNSIALESLQKKIIKGISVINNYEDDFSVSFNENKETVLNIDTRVPNKRLTTGSAKVQYGYRDKYHIEGKGFLFWNGLNAFATHNTNNIGKISIKSGEIKQLFTAGQPFSPYRLDNLIALFNTEENLKKDFFSGTNLTLRKQSRRLKTFGLFYYLSPDRINRIFERLSSLNGESLVERKNRFNNRLHSFLASGGGAYKISTNTVAYYSLNVDYTRKNNKGSTDNQLFGQEQTRRLITSFFGDKTFSSFAKAALKSKLNKKLILETNASYYHENTRLNRSYLFENHLKNTTLKRDYSYTKQQGKYSITGKYKISEAFIPSILTDHTYWQDKITNGKQNKVNLMGRKAVENLLRFSVKGNELLKFLRYEISVGLRRFQTEIKDQSSERYFVPVRAFLNYENKLSRYRFEYTRKIESNDLDTGISDFVSSYKILEGDVRFPLHFYTKSSLSAGYYTI